MPRKNLTDALVRSLKPGPKQYEIMDGIVPGLAIRISPGGKRTFILIARFPGGSRHPTRRAIGTYPAIGIAAARKIGRNWSEQIAVGNNPTAKAEPEATFSEVAQSFIHRYAKKNNKTWRQTAGVLGLSRDPKDHNKLKTVKGGLTDKWRNRLITDLTKRDVIDAINKIMDRGTPYRANRTLAAIRKFFNWCVQQAIIDTSPCIGLKAPAKEKSRDRVLSEEELRILWQAWDKKLEWPWQQYYKTLLWTAQRRSEVANMRWQDLDLDNKLWTLPREQTKADRVHEVPLSDPVADLLRQTPRFQGPFVFSTTAGKRPVQGLSKPKIIIDEHVKIKPWRNHDLRRTAATEMAKETPPHVLAAILNHAPASTQGITAIYNRHRYSDEKRIALDAWAQRLKTIVSSQDESAMQQGDLK